MLIRVGIGRMLRSPPNPLRSTRRLYVRDAGFRVFPFPRKGNIVKKPSEQQQCVVGEEEVKEYPH